jgi:hypothetical protein
VNVDPRDPFEERSRACVEASVGIVGAELAIRSTDQVLLDLALEAFGNLPKFATNEIGCELRIQLSLNECGKSWKEEPPPPVLSSGHGLLSGAIDSGNFVIVDPENRRAVVSVSRSMLRHPHLVRYELIELAVLTLVGRALSLVPLHGASVGLGDSGLLVVGTSGAGKSTLCLLALVDGLQVLSEDSVFVNPRDLSVFGLPNFLHLRHDALDFLEPGPLRDHVTSSPTIRRRSGIQKFAINLREQTRWSPPLRTTLTATVFLCDGLARSKPALRPLDDPGDVLMRMSEEQPYAVGLPEWSEFSRAIAAVPCFELSRTDPPSAAIAELRTILTRSSASR